VSSRVDRKSLVTGHPYRRRSEMSNSQVKTAASQGDSPLGMAWAMLQLCAVAGSAIHRAVQGALK
jgi:hypothetical protein